MRIVYVVGWALFIGGWLIVLFSLLRALDWQGCRAWGCWLVVGALMMMAVLVFVTSVLGVRFS